MIVSTTSSYKLGFRDFDDMLMSDLVNVTLSTNCSPISVSTMYTCENPPAERSDGH